MNHPEKPHKHTRTYSRTMYNFKPGDTVVVSNLQPVSKEFYNNTAKCGVKLTLCFLHNSNCKLYIEFLIDVAIKLFI